MPGPSSPYMRRLCVHDLFRIVLRYKRRADQEAHETQAEIASGAEHACRDGQRPCQHGEIEFEMVTSTPKVDEKIDTHGRSFILRGPQALR